MKKIAIMGAGGFVGRSLVEHFKDRYNLYPITREQFNMLDEKAVKKFFDETAIDVVINCANQGGSRKTGYDHQKADIVDKNLRMFFFIERCLTPDMKLINFGSGAQYDKARDLIKVEESKSGEHIPKDDYGFSKYVLSKYINKHRLIYNPVIFGLFGRYEDYSFKFISNSILKNIMRLPIDINQNVIFDYLYINDFLKIIELIIENDYNVKEFNITPDDSIDIVSIAKIINQCGSFKSEIIIRNEGYNYQYTGSNKLLKENFPDFKFTPYVDSINELYRYYYDHFGNINQDMILKDEYMNNCKIKNKRK